MGLTLAIGILAGVRAASVGQETPGLLLAGLLVIAGLICARSLAPLALLAALGIGAGVLLADLRDQEIEARIPADESGPFTGRILTDPRVGGRGTFARFAWRDQQGGRHESLLFLPAGVIAGRGDRVDVSGQLDGPAGERIYGEAARVVERAGRVELARREIRDELARRIQARAPGSAGTLALGLLIGDDSALTTVERDALRASGLSHITAVSGWNVTVVIGFVALLLRALGRRGAFWFGVQIAGIVGYVWLVGAEPPVVRAAIMGSLALVALALGRPAHQLTLLVLAAAAMAAHDATILGSLSFQLSFLATVGLMVASKMIESSDGWAGKLAGLVAAPAAAALATTPLIAARFGTLSLATVPANLIVAPLVAPATLLGAVAAVVASFPVAGVAAGAALWLVCSAILELARLVAGIPGSQWSFAPLSPAATAGIYLVLGLLSAPLIPESRAAARGAMNWAEDAPLEAVAAAVSMLCALVGMALVLMPN